MDSLALQTLPAGSDAACEPKILSVKAAQRIVFKMKNLSLNHNDKAELLLI